MFETPWSSLQKGKPKIIFIGREQKFCSTNLCGKCCNWAWELHSATFVDFGHVYNINQFLNYNFFPQFLFLLYLIPPILWGGLTESNNRINLMSTKLNLLSTNHTSSSVHRWRKRSPGRLSDLPKGKQLEWHCWSSHTWPLSSSSAAQWPSHSKCCLFLWTSVLRLAFCRDS